MTDVLVVNNNPDNLPGSYTQQLIARVHEAGLRTWEARSVDHLSALVDRRERIGLIISCGSPVDLTEAVDLRAHVCKTTAAMLHFPDAPVVGICYGMQLLALLYGGTLKEQRDAPHRGVWVEMRRTEMPSRLLQALPQRFSQKASNYIFVEQLPRDFVATTLDATKRVMSMEHVSEHVYGIQWHPEVIGEHLGPMVLQRVFALLGRCRREAEGDVLPAVAFRVSSCQEKEVSSLHELDLELRQVVKELVSSAGKRASVELGKVLAGKRKELMITLRGVQPGTGGDGDLSSLCAMARQELREVASAWLNNPAPAG